MKKNKLLLGLAILASFALTSCGSDYVKARGTEEDFGDIEIPDVFKDGKTGDSADSVHYIVKHMLENKNGGYDVAYTETLTAKKGEKTNATAKQYTGYKAEDISQVDVALDGSTIVYIKYSIVRYTLTLTSDTKAGSVAGEGEYKISDGSARLVAKPFIGYDFIGWYLGDTLLSTKLSYSLTLDSNLEVRAEFKVKDEFKDYTFDSGFTSCTLTGLNDLYMRDANVPEGVTEIGRNAFYHAYTRFINLPTTLKHVDSGAFDETYDVLRITINSDITCTGYPFGSNIYEVLNLGNTDLSSVVSEYLVYRTSLDQPSEFSIDSNGFIFRTYVNYMSQDTCVCYGNVNDAATLTLPSSYTINGKTYNSYSINRYSFVNANLKVLYIPEAVTEIEEYAFIDCKNLTEIFNYSNISLTLGYNDNGGVATYAKIIHTEPTDSQLIVGDKYDYYIQNVNGIDYAVIVSYRDKSSDLVIDKVENYPTIIGPRVFQDRDDLESVTLNDGIISVEEEAFEGCNNLTILNAKYLKNVGYAAFSRCNLKSIDISNCEYIESCGFYSNGALKEVKADKLKQIGDYAFYSCSALYQISLPVSLQSIEESAFENCVSLIEVINHSSITLEANSTDNGYVAYYSISIINSESNSILVNDNDYIKYMDLDYGYKIVSYIGDSKELVIPTNAYAIRSYAFIGLDIDSLTINNNIKCIDNDALYNLSVKTLNICLNEDILDNTTQAKYWFNYNYYWYSCYIDNLIIRGNIEYLPERFFDYIYATTVVLPESITYLNSYCFEFYNIESIYYNSTFEDFLNIDGSKMFFNHRIPNLYLKDTSGDIEYLGNKYSVLDTFELTADMTLSSNQFEYYPFRKLIIAEGVTSIPDSLFRYCSKLEEVQLPSTMTNIGYAAFAECRKLNEITLNEGIAEIGGYAFDNTSIKTLTIPSSVTYIDDNAFSNCKSLIAVTYKSSVSVSDYMFSECSTLQSVRFLGNVESIGRNAFYGTTALNKISLPSTVSSIDSSAFSGSAIREIDLSNLSITSIEYNTFSNCKNLTTVIFPETLTSIASNAFENTKIKNLVILDTITSIGSSAFSDCYYLETVTFNGNTELDSSIFSGCRSLRQVTLPNSITTIPGSIFKDCNSLASIDIPSGVTSIESNAFSGCTALANITLSDNITNLGDKCFNGCIKLPYNKYGNGIYLGDSTNPYKFFIEPEVGKSEITIHEDTKVFVGHSFTSSVIEKVIVPSTIQSMPKGLFYKCDNLTELEIPFTGDGSSIVYFNYLFDSNNNNIPSTLKKVTINSGERIGQYAFQNVTNIETVVLANTITSISTYAFKGSGIKNIVIPASLKNIYQEAFSGCTKLESIDLSLMDITSEGTLGNQVFYGCTELASATLPVGIKTIPANLFSGCTSLSSITIPNTVTSIGAYAFYKCGLTEINIPTSVTTLGNYSFGNMTKLESITIPSSITSIPTYCFYACGSLKEVNLADSVTEIGTKAFQNCDIRSFIIKANITSIGDSAFNGNKKLYDVVNLSSLEITAGATTNGYVGYYAKSIHTDMSNRAFFFIDGAYTVLVDDGDAYIIEYNPSSTDVIDLVLPDSFTYDDIEYEEYRIDSNVFMNNSTIGLITIPATVRAIGKNAFSYSRITGINFLGSTITIDASAFYYCTRLKGSITLPSGIYGARAFYNCIELESVTFKDGESYIYSNAFQGCNNLTSVTLGEGLVTIDDNVFASCSNLTHMDIPSSVKYVGAKIFYECYNMKTVTFKEGSILESVGESAFYGLELKDCSLPTTLNSVGKLAFGNLIATSITLPHTLENIGVSAFEGAKIEEVIINCDMLSAYIFRNCKNLSTVTINGNVRTISEYAFYGCDSLSSFTIPASVVGISSYAFSYAGLESITVPSTVSTINKQAFSMNESLVSATIETSLTSLPEALFLGCSQLTSVTLPNTITTFNNNVFKNCTSLESITLPTSLTTLGQDSFYQCYKLNNVVLNEGIESIPYECFAYCKALTTITFPSTLTSIGEYAFRDCDSFESFVIPNTVTEVNSYAFSSCDSLKTITIPASVKKLYSYAFSNCQSLESITIPSTVTTIGNYLCSNSTKLKEAYVYSSTMSQYMFYKCSALEYVVLNESISSIPYAAFNSCTSLSSVYSLSTSSITYNSGSYNTEFTNASKYWYSENEPEDLGVYWHYNTDNKPEIWN